MGPLFRRQHGPPPLSTIVSFPRRVDPSGVMIAVQAGGSRFRSRSSPEPGWRKPVSGQQGKSAGNCHPTRAHQDAGDGEYPGNPDPANPIFGCSHRSRRLGGWRAARLALDIHTTAEELPEESPEFARAIMKANARSLWKDVTSALPILSQSGPDCAPRHSARVGPHRFSPDSIRRRATEGGDRCLPRRAQTAFHGER